MKALAVFSMFLFILTMSCGSGSGNPGDAVTAIFDALKAGDGESAVSYMSEGAIAEMDDQLETIKADPEESALQLAALGIEIDAAAIPDMTGKEFLEIMFSSPTITSMVQSAEVTIGEITIEGDTAKVDVTTTIMDRTETNTIEVIREDGQWKVTEFGMNF